MKFKNILRIISYAILIMSVLGCSSSRDWILYGTEDLQGSHIAILDNAVSEEDFEKRFPESHAEHFRSSSEFLLALAIGKCDAGIAGNGEAGYLLNKNYDYERLGGKVDENDSVTVIVHKRLLPGRNEDAFKGDIIDQSIERIDRSIISDNYWMLILKGLGVTVIIFVSGVILAFLLAVLMTWMNYKKSLKWISRPASWFIRTIHDVPSVVLIFFFYYFVFASLPVNGIIVCIISLGVYSSGSFMNIFNVHLNQIDKTQHDAAQMLGLTGWKKYRYVILPQAVKPMLPLLAAESKVLLRATSYAGYISQVDLVKVTEIIRNQTYDVLVPLLLVSVVFLLLSRLIVESLSLIYEKAFSND